MTHRERFITTINRGKPDRVPVVGNLTIQLAEKLAKRMNLPVDMQDSNLATRISHRDILLELGNDAVLVAPLRHRDKPTIEITPGRSRDEFGIEYEQVGLYNEAVFRPLSNAETEQDIVDFDWPRADDPGRWDFAEMVISKHSKDYGVIGDLEATIFEMAWNLVGMEKFLMDLYTEEAYINPLLDKLMEFSMECGFRMIDMGCDMIWTGDDVGTQSGMMISPDIWRQHLKPRMKTIFNAFKKRNPNIIIAYHSCGAIRPIIPELIEIGLDVLNPIQPLAENMELGSIYKEFGDKLLFFGAIDVQNILPNGSPEDVRAEVKRVIDATDGGQRLIIAPAHNMQPDTPLENIYAFYDAVREFGIIK